MYEEAFYSFLPFVVKQVVIALFLLLLLFTSVVYYWQLYDMPIHLEYVDIHTTLSRIIADIFLHATSIAVLITAFLCLSYCITLVYFLLKEEL